jgi:hypothetical protein
MTEISVFIRVNLREKFLSHKRILKPERGPSTSILILVFPASRIVGNKCLLVQSFCEWYSTIAAKQLETDSLTKES